MVNDERQLKQNEIEEKKILQLKFNENRDSEQH